MSKTNTLIQRIKDVDNFQNMACFCSNWEEFCIELNEWGVYSAAKIDFDDVIKGNIKKLEKRYPGGSFTIGNSENRKAGDR